MDTKFAKTGVIGLDLVGLEGFLKGAVFVNQSREARGDADRVIHLNACTLHHELVCCHLMLLLCHSRSAHQPGRPST